MRRLFRQGSLKHSRHTTTPTQSDFSAFCRTHRETTDLQLRRDLEVHVWRKCSALASADAEKLTIGETVSLMHTFLYFERWWNRGLDGPCEEQFGAARQLSFDLASSLSVSRKPKRESFESQPQVVRPRTSPLDEIFE
ncbi:Hypothetical protein, putative [Bodo saltans]|uniref:RNA-editing substrate-binding complex 7 protein domain-containing protein n=1 Tax=Bodo saltans TaxID=75058 RepID=A0A0S4JMT3_BODSA|nr:Hypothetical protein, putative [Bodo saltans]|eukprot:CUG91516.1 Hypothetical protein, putative [Bodo saltans]